MKILKDSIFTLPSEGRMTVQIPMFSIGGVPEIEDLPDEWFIFVKDYSPCIGKETGFLYLSRKGYVANKDKIKEVFLEGYSKRIQSSNFDKEKIWNQFDNTILEFYEKVDTKFKQKIALYRKKLQELEESYSKF